MKSWNELYEIMHSDKLRLERIIENQKKEIHSHEEKMNQIRAELNVEIEDRDARIEKLLHEAEVKQKKLINYGDVETDLNLFTIYRLQEKLEE